MFVMGVKADKWITYAKVKFPRQLTVKDISCSHRNKGEEDDLLFDTVGNPLMGVDETVYFTFQGKNYLGRLDSLAKYIPQMSVKIEPLGFWEFLKTKGLTVGSNAEWWNNIIHTYDVLGVEIKHMMYVGKGVSLETFQDAFLKAKELLSAVGVEDEPELRVDQKYAAD